MVTGCRGHLKVNDKVLVYKMPTDAALIFCARSKYQLCRHVGQQPLNRLYLITTILLVKGMKFGWRIVRERQTISTTMWVKGQTKRSNGQNA